MSSALSIRLKKTSKVYYEGEVISGLVIVESSTEVKHEGLALHMEGSVNLQQSTKNIGILDAFTNSIKPIQLVNTTIELLPAGKIPAGIVEIPFEMPLRTSPGLLETYHGVFINVMYVFKCHMKRSFLNKPLNTSCQFFVQHRQQAPITAKPVQCEISPQSIGGRNPGAVLPDFLVRAHLDSTVCSLDRPFTGQICVERCAVPIKCIELQLVRVETCGCPEGFSRDATEIQSIQVGDGDVSRGLWLPLYMVLPRLFVCPTTTTANFKIEFELNIAVLFEDDHLITENFPILLVRSR